MPPQLSDDRRDELLQKYGATKTRTLRPFGKHSITFAKFPSQELATEALLRLHQLNVGGQYLTVEYAKSSVPADLSEQDIERKAPANNDAKTETVSKSHVQAFLRKLNNWTMSHEFSQSPPPNITYRYMMPTRSTLTRIAIQLLTQPAFYTQVKLSDFCLRGFYFNRTLIGNITAVAVCVGVTFDE